MQEILHTRYCILLNRTNINAWYIVIKTVETCVWYVEYLGEQKCYVVDYTQHLVVVIKQVSALCKYLLFIEKYACVFNNAKYNYLVSIN